MCVCVCVCWFVYVCVCVLFFKTLLFRIHGRKRMLDILISQ